MVDCRARRVWSRLEPAAPLGERCGDPTVLSRAVVYAEEPADRRDFLLGAQDWRQPLCLFADPRPAMAPAHEARRWGCSGGTSTKIKGEPVRVAHGHLEQTQGFQHGLRLRNDASLDEVCAARAEVTHLQHQRGRTGRGPGIPARDLEQASAAGEEGHAARRPRPPLPVDGKPDRLS
jgi:hypothetical protein